MSKKIYVKDYTRKNADGDELQVCKVYMSKPRTYKYIVFMSKRA